MRYRDYVAPTADDLKMSAAALFNKALGIETYQPPPSYQPTQSDGIFGLPKTIAMVGGAVLVGGLILMAMKKKPSAMAGYRRRRRRR